MKPKRIILIRHGESTGNINKGIYQEIPDYALELSDKGKEQATKAGEQLKKIVQDETLFFYVSPMWRTRSTFEQITVAFDKTKLRYIEEPRIREQEWGHLRTVDENENIQSSRDGYGTFYFRIPDGESAADVFDRMSDFFGTLHRDFEKDNFPDNAVIISHGMTIRLFLMRWFHWTVEEFEILSNPRNCEMMVLERNNDNKYTLKTEPRKRAKPQHSYQRPTEF